VLVALGGALDNLFSASWRITQQNVKRCVRSARVLLQDNEWSCGYHLLHCWTLLFARLNQADGAIDASGIFDHVNTICSAALLPADERVSFVRAEYDKRRAAQK